MTDTGVVAGVSDSAARAREQECETLMTRAPDVVVRFDRDLRHLSVNPAVEGPTGSPPEHFLGRYGSRAGHAGGAVRVVGA